MPLLKGATVKNNTFYRFSHIGFGLGMQYTQSILKP